MRFFITPRFPPGYFVAITLWPIGIFFKSEYWKFHWNTRRHEKIHWEQQKEMLGILFYVWYGIEYLVRLIQYRSHWKAYKRISFEMEANCFETTAGYLEDRPRYWWIKFL